MFQNFPKIVPKGGRPTLSTESTSRQQKSSQVEQLGSLRELVPLHLSLSQNRRALLALVLVFKSPSLVVRPCSLIGISKVTIVNCRVLWGCCAPSQTHVFKRIVTPLCRPGHPNESSLPLRRLSFPNELMLSSIVIPLRTDAPNLSAPLMSVHPNLLVASYLGKPLGVFASPRRPLSQLGC
jgi:hypothetical protein